MASLSLISDSVRVTNVSAALLFAAALVIKGAEREGGEEAHPSLATIRGLVGNSLCFPDREQGESIKELKRALELVEGMDCDNAGEESSDEELRMLCSGFVGKCATVRWGGGDDGQ